MNEDLLHLAVIPSAIPAQVIPPAKFGDIREQFASIAAKVFEKLLFRVENEAHLSREQWTLHLTGDTAVGPFVVSPKTGNDWGYTSIKWGAENELSLENERLKTQLMAEKRTVLQERRRSAELLEQNEKLWDCLADLSKQNQTLVGAMIGRSGENLCFTESHKGVVTEVMEGNFTVCYTTPSGAFLKQVYRDAQFIKHRVPNAGDCIEAHVIVTTAPRVEPETIDEARLERAFRGFEKGKVGRHTL